MKKHTFVYLIAICAGSLVISGYHSGAGNNGYDCTGAETGLGNSAGCSGGNGCHSPSATTAITVALELDSAGVATTHYKGGVTYTIKLTGTNTSTTSLPKFGFEVGSVKGSTSVVTPVNAGTFATPYPANTHYAAPNQYMVVGVVEQSATLAATTGTGGSGTKYVESFTWTAPVAGTGTISFWGVINAVNGNGSSDSGEHWNT